MDYNKDSVYTIMCVDTDHPNLLITVRVDNTSIRHVVYVSGEPITTHAYDKDKCVKLTSTPIESAFALGHLYKRILKWKNNQIPLSAVLTNNTSFITFLKET